MVYKRFFKVCSLNEVLIKAVDQNVVTLQRGKIYHHTLGHMSSFIKSLSLGRLLDYSRDNHIHM